MKAGNTATLHSGGNTTLAGAVVAANRVKADVAGSLAIASLQDTSTYTSQQSSVGGSLSLGGGGITGGGISAGKSDINSAFQSTNAQSGLKAGDGGFAVTVGGNTALTGGVIASTQAALDAGKNTFTTGASVSITDIHNSASFSGEAVGVSLEAGKQDGKMGVSGVGVGLGSDKGNAASTTAAGITGVAGNTAVRTGDADTGLAKTFDAAKVQRQINAQVAVTQALSQQAPKAVASLADSQIAELKKDLDNDRDETQKAAITTEIDKWAEGGGYRVALHSLTGALSGAISGALGAAASASAAPLLQQLQGGVASSLQTAGLSPEAATGIARGIAGLTAAGVGAAVGGTAGAASALTIDANNRQLHPAETQRIKDLAGGNLAKQARLTEAACALVRCADGVPRDDANYAYLKGLQDAGASLTEEKALLSQQQGQQGRIYGQLFQYTGVDQYIIDPAKQNKLGTRLAGAVQAGAGIAGVAGSGALCTTGVGCAAGAITGTVSADYGVAGIRQAATGNAAVPYGEQVLQSLGLSPQAAALTYAVLGIAPAGVEAAAISRAANVQAALSTDARLSYISIEKFGAQGVQVTTTTMQTPQAQAIVREYQAAGLSKVDAERYAKDLIQTGVDLPTQTVVRQGEELIKIVPKIINAGEPNLATTPFFMTRQAYDALLRLPSERIAQQLGLPAQQGIRGTQLGFDAYSITPKLGATPNVFVSEVAPIQQGAYSATGGAQQVLVPNRMQWTDPVKIVSTGGGR